MKVKTAPSAPIFFRGIFSYYKNGAEGAEIFLGWAKGVQGGSKDFSAEKKGPRTLGPRTLRQGGQGVGPGGQGPRTLERGPRGPRGLVQGSKGF